MLVRPTVGVSKLLSLIVSALIALTGLSACAQSGGDTSSNNTTQNHAPIKIGASISLSGDFSDDGKALRQGYQLWADAVNKNGGLLGRQVQLDLLSDNSTKEQVTTNYQKMITVDHDDLVVGPFASALTIPASAVAHRFGYAFVEGAGTSPAVFQSHFDNLFSVSLPAAHYLNSFVDYILAMPQDQRPKTVAYATSDDFFTQPQVDTAREKLEQGGVQTAIYQRYPAETTDYNSIALKVVHAHADVVILGNVAPAECVAFLKAFRQQHYNPSAIIATSGPDQGDQFTGPLGGAQVAEGIFVPNDGWFPGIKTYQNDQFTAAYLAKYGGTADAISSDTIQAYAVGQVLEQAVNKIHSVDNKALIQELHNDTFNTVEGPVKFGADGQNTVAVAFLFQWQNGKLIPVYPSNQAQANPEFPKKPWP